MVPTLVVNLASVEAGRVERLLQPDIALDLELVVDGRRLRGDMHIEAVVAHVGQGLEMSDEDLGVTACRPASDRP